MSDISVMYSSYKTSGNIYRCSKHRCDSSGLIMLSKQDVLLQTGLL